MGIICNLFPRISISYINEWISLYVLCVVALYAPCEDYRVCLNGHEKGHYNHKVHGQQTTQNIFVKLRDLYPRLFEIHYLSMKILFTILQISSVPQIRN